MAYTRLGGDGPQDSAFDSVDEVESAHSDALVARGLSGEDWRLRAKVAIFNRA